MPTGVALCGRDVDSHDLDDAILRAIVYADVFDYPLTSGEIHHYLIGHPASASAIEERLARAGGLRERLGSISPFWFLPGREDLVSVRQEREAFARRLWPAACRYSQWIAAVPFVRMVALTGSLAMNNVSSPHDDIDLLIVTQHSRVWLARGLIALLVHLARRRGAYLCPNYILSERSLELGDHPAGFVRPQHGPVRVPGAAIQRHALPVRDEATAQGSRRAAPGNRAGQPPGSAASRLRRPVGQSLIWYRIVAQSIRTSLRICAIY